mmetsp:Transcript_17502/g.25892  ORF Transcript_17502/g.25892 Transcript_17502/m.25892 type:complete len:262 (-) Transcript_17502:27-812(-)
MLHFIIICVALATSAVANNQAPCPVVPEDGCSICGDGLCVTKPHHIFQNPGEPDHSCKSLEESALQGELSEVACLSVRYPALGTCDCEAQRPLSLLNIPSRVAVDGQFNKLVDVLNSTKMVEGLSEGGPFTIFAPTDEAFSDLPDDTFACLLQEENEGMLREILSYHVVRGKISSSDVSGGQTSLNYATITVNDSDIVHADILAANGIIHSINKVFIPPGVDVSDVLNNCMVIESRLSSRGWQRSTPLLTIFALILSTVAL